ncbi:unnamed protein product [Closterium sp. Yama58-4]|nr:unnamed protein product [Closterium sp. Yama58-4]
MASEADRLRLELRASRAECAELRSRLEKAGPAGIERAQYGVGGEREAELAQRVEELTREVEAERQEAHRARRFHEDELTMLLASNKDKEAVWTRKEMELEQELRELREQLSDARQGHALGGQLQALEDRLADAREVVPLSHSPSSTPQQMEQVQDELRRERELLRSTETVAEAEWLRRVAAERANAALQRDVERAQLDADELWSALEAFRAEGAGVAEQLRVQMEAAVREAAERERAHRAAMARVDEEVERLAEEAEAAAEREELAAQLIDRLKDHNALLARQLAAMAKRAGAGAGGAARAVGESGHLLLSGATPIASSGALQARAAVGLKELQASRDALRIAMRGVRERAALAAEAQQRAAGGQGRRGKAGRKAEAGAVGEMLAEVEEEVVEGQSLVERAERIVARMAALESKGAGVGKKMEGKRKRLAELEARLGLAPRRGAGGGLSCLLPFHRGS